jgi:hypothetical protein
LDAVKDELLSKSSSSVPRREVRVWVADATSPTDWDFSALKELKLTAIFLAAGGAIKPYYP